MKTISISILLLTLWSCKTRYIDDFQKETYYKSNTLQIEYFENYNYFAFFPIDGTADHDIILSTYFEIQIPKKLVLWKKSGNYYFFEMEDRQIIYIRASHYDSKIKSLEWELENFDPFLNSNYGFHYYWINERGYNENSLLKNKKSRVTKSYKVGNCSITLYNIKKENFENYLNKIKNFKIISRNSLD